MARISVDIERVTLTDDDGDRLIMIPDGKNGFHIAIASKGMHGDDAIMVNVSREMLFKAIGKVEEVRE